MRVAVLGSFILLFTISAFAQDKAELVKKFFEKAEIGELNKMIIESMNENLAEAEGEMGANAEKLKAAFGQAYDQEKMDQASMMYIQDNFDEKLIAANFTFMETELFKKMAAAEEYAETPEGEAAMQTYLEGLQDSAPAKERVAMIARFDEVTQVSGMVAALFANSTGSLQRGLNMTVAPEERTSEEEINAGVANMKQQMHAMMRNMMVGAMLFMYKDFSTDQLQEYFTFYETDAGRYYNDTIIGALNASYDEANLKVGQALGKVQSEMDEKKM